MIYHFVNLVGWKEIQSILHEGQHKVYCDSISMAIAVKLCLGTSPKLVSGVGFARTMLQTQKNVFFLLPDLSVAEKLNLKSTAYDVLPKIELGDITNIDIKIPKHIDQLVIAISSPKQNLLAQTITLQNPDLDLNVYCLGAAIGVHQTVKWFDILHLNFLYFMIKEPKRFIHKVKFTTVAIFRLCAFRNERQKFRDLIQKMER